MIDRSSLAIIEATLKKRGFVYVGPGVSDYVGRIKVHGKEVDIRIEISSTDFTNKPKIFLLDRKQIPAKTLAHIEVGTGICYSSAAGLPIDMYEPGQGILRVLQEAQLTLERSYGGNGKQEMIDEYQSYWQGEGASRVLIKRPEQSCRLMLQRYLCVKGDKAFYAIHNKNSLNGYDCKVSRPTIFWHIEEDLGPSSKILAPDTLKEFESWLFEQSAFKKVDWDSIMDSVSTGGAFFLSASNAILGFEIELPSNLRIGLKNKKIRPVVARKILERQSHLIKINRLSGVWYDLNSLTNRNNDQKKSFSTTKIALVGCGTIGSQLARMLVQSGAGIDQPLTLFDNDILTGGNISRHLLNFDNIGSSKVESLQRVLEEFHPEVKVLSIHDDALQHTELLLSHDLIIDATGDWNIQSALNDLFLKSNNKKVSALLHSWVFMNGSAVQSFLNLKDSFACFRCLRPIFSGPWRYAPIQQNEELRQRPAMCGDGSYIPFTVDVSAIAAAIANKSALDWINDEPGARLRTIVTDLAKGRNLKPISPLPATNCPACASYRVK